MGPGSLAAPPGAAESESKALCQAAAIRVLRYQAAGWALPGPGSLKRQVVTVLPNSQEAVVWDQ
jgi:hypothetical protein